LGIDLVYEGVKDKVACLEAVLAQTGIRAEAAAFVGDDLPDLPIMNRVAIGIAVADATASIRSAAAMVTTAAGGQGAVREVCESILIAKGVWESILARYNA
jgi:3-deoxy-D-manno-octulosonate 8-phosphate phosphatase (KDO 8-P phosphatase)